MMIRAHIILLFIYYDLCLRMQRVQSDYPNN